MGPNDGLRAAQPLLDLQHLGLEVHKLGLQGQALLLESGLVPENKTEV